MIKKVCAIYDTQAKFYSAPFFAPTIGDAVRSFSDAVNDKNMGMLSKHPEDFILYDLGTWDDTDGLFTASVPVVRLGLGSDFVKLEVK